MNINNIIEFNDETGLKVSSRGEILEDLKYLTKVAYGSDYVIEQGNEWYSFLDLLAGALTDMSGAIQKVYNSLSFVGASGTNLDNVVSFVGITRKPYKNSTVLIKVELPKGSTRPFTIKERGIVLTDTNDNSWTNTSYITIAEFKQDGVTDNYIGTGMFEATDKNTDPTNIVLQPYNDRTNNSLKDINEVAPSGTTFINEIASELGNLEENDAQLRARYKAELYKNSVGTLEGLKAALLEKADVTYVYIIENNSETETEDGMPPHSIWVITDGKSTWEQTFYQITKDSSDNYIFTITQGSSNFNYQLILDNLGVCTGVKDLQQTEKETIYPVVNNTFEINSIPYELQKEEDIYTQVKDILSDDPEDIKIGNIILNYASLGCANTNAPDISTYNNGTGPIAVQIAVDSTEYNIKFSRATEVPCYVNVTLATDLTDTIKKNSIESEVKENIVKYIESLGISEDVLQSGLSSAVFEVITENAYKDYVFDIDSITVGRTTESMTKRLSMNVNEYSSITEDNITIVWGGN